MLFSPQILIRRYLASAGAVVNSAVYTNFIARTSGLTSRYLDAYAALLNGMTTDGLFDGSGNTTLFDQILIYATKDTATSLLDLTNNANNAVAVGSPTFTQDQGYSVMDGSNHINTQVNPFSGTFLYQRDDAHLSIWSNQGTPDGLGYLIDAGGSQHILTNVAGSAFFRVNDATAIGAFSVSDSLGFYVGARSASNAWTGNKNGGASTGSGSDASIAISNNVFRIGNQCVGPALASTLGKNLSSGQIANLYARLHTYLQTIAGIA